MSGLHDGTTEVASSNLLTLTQQNCVIHRFTFWFAGQPSRHRSPDHFASYVKSSIEQRMSGKEKSDEYDQQNYRVIRSVIS